MDKISEAEIARRAGVHMAMRYLMSDLYNAIIRQQSDPRAYAEAWKKRSIDAVDGLLDKGGNEVLNHAALHEVETFWDTVLRAVP